MSLGEQEVALIVGTLTILGALAGLVARLVWNFIKHKDETIDELRRRLQQAEQDRELAAGQRQAAYSERDAAIAARVAAETQRDAVVGERDRLRSELQRATAAYRTEVGKREAAEKRAADAEQRAVAAEKNLAELAALRDRLKTDSDQLRRAAGEQIARVQHLERRLAAEIARREQAERAAADCDRLRTDLTAEIARRERTEARIAELTARVADLEAEVRRYENQVNSIAESDGRVWEKPVPDTVPPFIPLAQRGTDDKPATPVISLLNLKGGVGKTTITANLAGFLSQHREKRVLLIDLDHQRSLTQMLLTDAERELAYPIHTVQRFFRESQRSGERLIDCSHPVPNLERCRIVTNASPADGRLPSLDDVEMDLMCRWLVDPCQPDVRFLLREALQSDIIRQQFDYVLIDCPPRLTTACIAALTASDFLLIPCQAESVALASVEHALQRLRRLKDAGLIAHLSILGVVPNMVPNSARDPDSAERAALKLVRGASQQFWGQPVPVFNAMLRKNDNHTRASWYLKNNEPLRLGIYYAAIREDFEALVTELEKRIRDESRKLAGVPA